MLSFSRSVTCWASIAARLAGLMLIGSSLIGSLAGCRSLGDTRRTKELSAARQRSLQGADELQQQNWNEAERLFNDALRRSSADERAHWGMAEVFYQRGESEAAIRHMQAAAQLSGDNPDLLVRLGEMHLQADRLEEAVHYADKALAGNRQCCAAWALRGQVLRQQNRLDDSLQCYHRALICQPNNQQVQLEIADLYRALDRPQRALATLDRFIEAQAGETASARAWFLKGQALADLGQRKEAQMYLQRATQLAREDDSDLLLQLAESQVLSGELAEARLCLGRALQHDPQNPKALAIQQELARRFDVFNRQEGLQVLPAGYGQQQFVPN
jgi:Tfp pilus assembly protein PilF